jgi:hypothetical protein
MSTLEGERILPCASSGPLRCPRGPWAARSDVAVQSKVILSRGQANAVAIEGSL